MDMWVLFATAAERAKLPYRSAVPFWRMKKPYTLLACNCKGGVNETANTHTHIHTRSTIAVRAKRGVKQHHALLPGVIEKLLDGSPETSISITFVHRDSTVAFWVTVPSRYQIVEFTEALPASLHFIPFKSRVLKGKGLMKRLEPSCNLRVNNEVKHYTPL